MEYQNVEALKLAARGIIKERRPTMESPRMESPRKESPRMERPRMESPRMERPRKESPRTERPRMESPRMERPRMESTSKKETIEDPPIFHPQTDCEMLHKAMRGLCTDKSAITSILAFRSNEQRQVIKTHFASMFGKILMKEIKSELRGYYERTVVGLLMTPAEFDAYECHEAIQGLGTDEKCLIEVLCSRTNEEILALREAYQRMYKKELEKEVRGDTSGDFRRLLVSLLQGQREESETVDYQRALQDARSLYEAGELRWGTDEARFNVILATRSFQQLRVIFDMYDQISRRSLEEAIRSEMSGALKEGMITIIKCARNLHAYFAERLHSSMKRIDTDNKTVIRILVSRSEIDITQIKEEFQKNCLGTLASFIGTNTSGEYRKILLHLCAGSYILDE